LINSPLRSPLNSLHSLCFQPSCNHHGQVQCPRIAGWPCSGSQSDCYLGGFERATPPPTTAAPQKRVSNENDTRQADDRICPVTSPFPKVFADVVPIFEETINLEINIVALVQFIVDLASLFERIHNIDIRK
jgi:hypothetical protein